MNDSIRIQRYGVLILLAWLLPAMLFLSCGKRPSSKAESRPNVILVSLDTLRADHIRGYGYDRETSPYLDNLMLHGTSFMNAVSQAPWTLPAHVSLFTSLYPHTHGVTSETLALNDETTTLSAALKDAGYRTGGFVTMPHLSPRHGFGKGFDAYVLKEVRAPMILEEALKWLGHVESETFFLFLHLFDVHTSYDPLPKYLSMFESSYAGDIDGKGDTLYKIRDGELTLSEEDLRHLVALYDAEIRQLDSALSLFFEALARRNIASNTIIIITADHGEEFLEHGGVLHGRTLFDELIRVPLIIVGPGIPAGKRIQAQVQLIDIMPTILQMCDIEVPASLEGRSLLPLIQKEHVEWRELAFAEADWRNEKHDIKRAVRNGRYKLSFDRLTGSEALYDLAEDPEEQVNILDKEPEIAASLRESLGAWMATPRGNPRGISLTEGERERLRALGYLR